MASNADRVRWGFGRLLEGDIEALISLAHEDLVFIPIMTGHTGEPYIGHEGVRQWYADVQEVFERVASRLESVEEIGRFVVVEGELVVIGSGEVPTVRQSVSWLVEMRGGKAARLEVLANRTEARRKAESQ